MKFIVLSAVLYAPGTLLYSWSRREQNQTVCKTSAWVIFILVGAGAMAGLYGLVTGSITIWTRTSEAIMTNATETKFAAHSEVGTLRKSMGDSGCVLAQRPGMDVRASSLGGPWAGHRPGRLRRRVVVAMLGLAATLISPHLVQAQETNRDTTDDGQEFLFDLLYGMPGRQEAVSGPSLLATDPGVEQQAPTPVFYLRLLAPLNYTSNAESRNSGGTRTVEGSPDVRLGFASQIAELPLRFSASVALGFDRYTASNSAEFDKIRPRAQLQYVDSSDDQAFSPFIGFSPRLDFTPTFDDHFATRYDLNVGVNKAFNFDGDFKRVPASGNSSAASKWGFGCTFIGQRRFRDPAPESYALLLIPSASYRISEDWSAALAIEFTQRWFEQIAGTSQDNFTLEPVAALEYAIPERWLGGPELTRWLGRPAVDFFGGVERNWSNVASAEFTRVFSGFAIKMAWRF